ncbi:MAG: hypothetical protein OXG35_07325 [Acidobacteria bacterium]|nr:hypothetical protein [Acidobacteriota bacterium]
MTLLLIYPFMNRIERFIRPWLHRRAIALLVVVLSLGGADAVAAQAGRLIYRSIPEKGDTTHTVVPGGRFKANRLRQWSYGSNYRQLWTTPIAVPVLDLDTVGGGLSPMRPG